MRSKVYVFASLLILFSMILGACQQAPQATPETIIQTVIVEGTPQVIEITATPAPEEPEPAGPKVLRVTSGGPGDVPTLDPSLGEDTSSIQIIEEVFVGLTRLNEVTSENESGMAQSWDEEVNADGEQVVTFHLLEGIPWVRWNGSEVEEVVDCEGNVRNVTANDFLYGIRRTLTPDIGSPYAYVLNVVKGAEAFSTGQSEDPESIGVRVVDDYTLEVTFVNPASYNVNIIGMWPSMALPSWLIEGDDCTEARGDRWTETGFMQSYGPFVMVEWVHDSFIRLAKNPFWPGIDSVPQPKVDEVHYSMLDAPPSFAEYEAGNLDTSPVPQADIDRVKSDPVLSEEFVIAPNLCTYFYGFNTQAPVVDDVRVRRALSLALDRQSLIDNVLKGGQIPAQWFSRPGLNAAPTPEEYPDLGVKYDPEQAKTVLQEYLDEMGTTAADLDITLMFNTSEGHRVIAEAIAQMWVDTLGIPIQVTNQEWQVFLQTVDSADAPQVWRMGWCLDYPDANNFLKEVTAVGGNNNPDSNGDGTPDGGFMWRNEEFEQLVDEAALEPDQQTRLELYVRAEEILVWEDAAMIPIYWYTRNTVTKPYIERTFGASGRESWEKWDILPQQ
ncbi:MAG TPA: peptide ABC transporter substrate-binding protein [Anaerolineaceae bacterium]|nr:peptide ABC transporter substrate-binding protein [Anaerolineaceae bacterium]